MLYFLIPVLQLVSQTKFGKYSKFQENSKGNLVSSKPNTTIGRKRPVTWKFIRRCPRGPQDSANILHFFPSMDFSPSEGQSFHLLSITVPAVALGRALPHYICHASKVARPNRTQETQAKLPSLEPSSRGLYTARGVPPSAASLAVCFSLLLQFTPGKWPSTTW